MKSTDNAIETSRKPNTDYTTAAQNDDDKNLSEKSNTPATVVAAAATTAPVPVTTTVNLLGDNTKNSKRDKSPTTICQNNGDTITNANDNTVDTCSKISADNNNANKKGENQPNATIITLSEPNTGAKRQQKTICYDFKKGMCRRRFCRVSC